METMATGRWRWWREKIEKCILLVWMKASIYHRRGREEWRRNQIAGTNVRSKKSPNQKARNDISLPKLNWITGALPLKSWFVLCSVVFSSDSTNHEQNILNYYSIWHFVNGVIDILQLELTLMALHSKRNLQMFEFCLK